MQLPLDISVSGKDVSSRKFVTTLEMTTSCDPLVKSCEIVGAHYRNRTSFGRPTAIREVFVQELATALCECMRDLPNRSQVVSLPEFIVEIDGLTLAGLHLMVTPESDDKLHIIARFKYFLGGLNHAFDPQIGFDDHLEQENSRISALVLSDLSLPLLNICAAAEAGLVADAHPIAKACRDLSDRSQELRFQIELVKRFVQRSGSPETRRKRDQMAIDTRHAYEQGLLGPTAARS